MNEKHTPSSYRSCLFFNFTYQMNQLYIFLFCFALASCGRNSIETKSEVLLDENKCKVVSFYPVVHARHHNADIESLNKHLRVINEMDRYIKNCQERNIIGDYKVLFDTDSLMNIEYVVKIDGRSRIRYRNIFIDMTAYKMIAPEEAIPNLQRDKLYPYVKHFNDTSGININLNAYEKGSNYAIMFGRTSNDLVLYLGGEGEFEGYYKLILPLKDVLK